MSILKIDLSKVQTRDSDLKITFSYSDIEVIPEFPDGPLIEIIQGELYLTPSHTPRHQLVLMNILRKLDSHVYSNKLGKVFPSPIDLFLSDNDYIIPDLIFISSSNKCKIEEKKISGIPDLIIEIVSSNRKRDFVDKKLLYERFQVPEYWIIDLLNLEVLQYVLIDKKYKNPTIIKRKELVICKLKSLDKFKIKSSTIFE